MTAPEPPPPLLAIRDLHVTVAGRHTPRPVLRGVSLAIPAGEVHGLVRPGLLVGGGDVDGRRLGPGVVPAGAEFRGGVDRELVKARGRRSRGRAVVHVDLEEHRGPGLRAGSQLVAAQVLLDPLLEVPC